MVTMLRKAMGIALPFRLSLTIATIATLSQAFPSYAQELGTSFGIPDSSPGVFWPRGMSLGAVSQRRLYPNGPNFGLSNTSGGFGLTGTGPISGIGLEERSVAPLESSELMRSSYYGRRIIQNFGAESSRSNSIFGMVLGNRLRREMSNSFSPDYMPPPAGALVSPYSLPSVDSVLRDLPASTDSILKTNL